MVSERLKLESIWLNNFKCVVWWCLLLNNVFSGSEYIFISSKLKFSFKLK